MDFLMAIQIRAKFKPQGFANASKTSFFFFKRWPCFDTTKATRENLTIWFKTNQKFLQVANPKTCKFPNQKARITTALAGALSEDDFVKNLQGVLNLLKHDKESKLGKKKQDLPSSYSSTRFSCSNEEVGEQVDHCSFIKRSLNKTEKT